MFKVWKKQLETQNGLKVKHLRIDNGLEFVFDVFNKYCKEAGITRHITVRGKLHQNGLAEKMNRTILEKVRCMLLSSGCTRKFWG